MGFGAFYEGDGFVKYGDKLYVWTIGFVVLSVPLVILAPTIGLIVLGAATAMGAIWTIQYGG